MTKTKRRKPLPLFPPAKTLLEVKQRTLKLLRLGWTQRIYARTCDGTPVGCEHPSATAVCIRGAIYRASIGSLDMGTSFNLRLSKKTNFNTVGFNDAPLRTASEVIALVKSIRVPGEAKAKG